jgi:hypothetical protein
MEKGVVYPEQRLGEEVITVVQQGSGTCTLDGKTLDLGSDSVLCLRPGMTRSLKAAAKGMKALEGFSPVRADLLALAGVTLPANAKVSFPDLGVRPSVQAGIVYNLNEIQLTPVITLDLSLSYRCAAATPL